MNDQQMAFRVVESLKTGIPPQRGVDLYSVGNEKLLDGIKKFHLSNISNLGLIRFISGSWGAGKTHIFRLLRELAFQNNCLVSNVELNVGSAALNKFESVLATIIREIETPSIFEGNGWEKSANFGTLIHESLLWLASGTRDLTTEITYEQYTKACELLMKEDGIDIDFRKMIKNYWETYLPESPEPTIVEKNRGEILQWFSCEGTISDYRKKYDVTKIITKENAKIMLQSLTSFVRLSGYSGLLILFDEAEQAYSVMRKSALKDAHNNLLSLINNIESLQGLYLIYATTPDFFTDPKHGIVIYGALSGRIGKPEDRQPRALDVIWNLDSIETNLQDYQEVAIKIRKVYALAYPGTESVLPDDETLKQKVNELFQMHPALASVRFWRLLVQAMIKDFDDYQLGETRPTKELYEDVMDRIRED